MKRERLMQALDDYCQRELPEFMLTEIHFHDGILSPVRDQGSLGTCSYVASVACVEMLCRKAKIEMPKCPGKYYFEINDVYDNLFKKYPDKDILTDVGDERGTQISDILRYIQEFGLPVTSVPMNPQEKNIYSFFCAEVHRHKIISYMRLERDDAFEMSNIYPIIANTYTYNSFNQSYEEIIYNGPDITETKPDPDYHSMVIVGNATLVSDNEVRKYLIAQNSWGEEFGCEGFVFMPMDKELLFEFWMPAVTSGMHEMLLDIESAREERANKRKLAQEVTTSEFQLEKAAAKSKNTIVETASKDGITEIMCRSKKDFPHNAHHREIAISISNYALKHGDSGWVIVGGRMEMQPHASENAGNVDLQHFAIYAFAGRSGELRWSIKFESSDTSQLIPQHNYKLDVHALNSRQPGEFECREFRESILGVMPHHWDRREDTLLKPTHFRCDTRKILKKSPGKINNYPFHKPEEKDSPGTDVTKKVSNVIEKVVTIAKLAETKKVWWVPNLVVTHEKEGIEAIHLASGRTLCKLHLQEGGLHTGIDGDCALDHVQVISYSPGLHGHDADWNWQLFTAATWSELPPPFGIMDSDVVPTHKPFPLHTHDTLEMILPAGVQEAVWLSPRGS